MAGTLGVVGSVVGIGSGLNSLFGGGSSGGGGQGTQAGGTIYDPFGLSNRQKSSGALMNLMGLGTSAPTSFTTDPSYQFRYNQGLDAAQRGAAASGMLGSGNRLAELMSYGQGMASQEYGNQFSRLAAMSGVGSWSGSNYGSQQLAQQQGGWNALAQGLGGLSNYGGFSSMFGGGTSTDFSGMSLLSDVGAGLGGLSLTGSGGMW